MSTQTRRAALVEAGLAKPGRGKFSKDANAWLDAQRANGVKFSDDDGPVKPAVVSPTDDTGPDSPAPKIPAGNSLYLTPDEYRFPEKEYRAVAKVGGKTVEYGMRECCNLCRVSLVNHACNEPTIHGNIAVTIERR
jgi:hypothetical protein